MKKVEGVYSVHYKNSEETMPKVYIINLRSDDAVILLCHSPGNIEPLYEISWKSGYGFKKVDKKVCFELKDQNSK